MRFGYTILYVPDVERTISFYEAAFGQTRRFVADSGEYGELDTGATTLAFAQEDFAEQGRRGLAATPLRPGAAPAAFEVGFLVDDVPAAVDAALAAGATPVLEPTQKPWARPSPTCATAMAPSWRSRRRWADGVRRRRRWPAARPRR